jgi:MarR family transcriptional regulator, organic hydroperoxide resistance regulator
MKRIAWEKITRFEGPEQSPGFLLWKVSTQWRRQIEAACATIGLTHSQLVVLASLGWLTRNGDNVTQVELARYCSTDVTMTSQILRSLEKKGYIKRRQHKGDARSKFSQVTEHGVALVEQAIPLVHAVDRQFFDVLGTDIKQYVEILQRLSI